MSFLGVETLEKKKTVHGTFKEDIKLNAYHVPVLHELRDPDYQARTDICHLIQVWLEGRLNIAAKNWIFQMR